MNPEETTPETASESLEVDTAFLIVRGLDGMWQVVGDITAPVKPNRQANRLDVRIGCSEMVNVINSQDIAGMVAENFAHMAAQSAAPSAE